MNGGPNSFLCQVVAYPAMSGPQFVTGHDLYSTSGSAAANGFVAPVANTRCANISRTAIGSNPTESHLIENQTQCFIQT